MRLFKDIEIIIVDDCGSDKSIDIAKEYAKKDKRIKIVHNEKKLRSFKSKI
ncbi:glycosyltransferase [Campylobacter jejuni]|nr:glycosyltransferase [Campylobacter jejuni]HEG8099548.1 glycosyltransferase [Campylobacter jejuni]